MGLQDIQVFVSADPQHTTVEQTAIIESPSISHFYFKSSVDFFWDSDDQDHQVLQCLDPCSPKAWVELYFTGTNAVFYGDLKGCEYNCTFQSSIDSSRPINHTWNIGDNEPVLHDSGQLSDSNHTIRLTNFTGTQGVFLNYAQVNPGLSAGFDESSTSPMFVDYSINSSVVYDDKNWGVERIGSGGLFADASTSNGTMAFTFDGISVSILGGKVSTSSESNAAYLTEYVNITLYSFNSSSPLIEESIISSKGYGTSPILGYKTYFNHTLDERGSPYTVFLTVRDLAPTSPFHFGGLLYQPAFSSVGDMANLTLPTLSDPGFSRSRSSSSRLGKGAIAGIVVGALVGLVALSGLGLGLLRRRRKKVILAKARLRLNSSSNSDKLAIHAVDDS